MESPVEQLKKMTAANVELVARIAGMEEVAAKAASDIAAAAKCISALEAEAAKRIEELAIVAQARDAALADLTATKAELSAANDTLSGKQFRHVAGAALENAATVAGGGEAGEEQKPFATKADALKAYDAVKRDAKAAQDFRRQHWAILGLSKPA